MRHLRIATLLGLCACAAAPPTAIPATLAEAEARFRRDPSEANTIWYGRRLAYAGRLDEAIAVYGEGLARAPASYRLLRHRGHRWISMRRFDRAVLDLTRAAELARDVPDEIEPDGQPNAKGIPRSTTQSNIWYHLGFAHWLRAEYGAALAAYDRCLAFARVNDDMLVATIYWRYLTLRRLAREAEARAALAEVTPAMDVIENRGYWRLLLAFRDGSVEELARRSSTDPVELATVGYGIGCWQLGAGKVDEARTTWRGVAAVASPLAFGRIAAEAELAR